MRIHSIEIPGSKSITNRALIIAAISNGETKLVDALISDDTKHMIAGLKKLGIKISQNKSTIIVNGGMKNDYTKPISFFCGNSGTTVRFLSALAATLKGTFTFDGDERMRERPIKDLCDALVQCGAKVEYLKRNGYAPFRITGPINNIECNINGSISSQFLSGLLLAAPNTKHGLSIKILSKQVSRSYIDLTISVMKSFGVKVREESARYYIEKNERYASQKKYTVEGDASSASYIWGISKITKIPIQITNISENSIQPDAKVKQIIETVMNSNNIKTIDCIDFPDAAMTIASLCALTNTTCKLTGLQTLRDKECNRIEALKTELQKLGVKVQSGKDFIKISGVANFNKSAKIETYNDHRMAMCFGMIQLAMPKLKITNPKCVSKTFPTFWKEINIINKLSNDRNIVLLGMRGAGKSSIAVKLGIKLNKKVVDTDREIEKITKLRIIDIVKRYGWKKFRQIEKNVINKISKRKKIIISTGGGVVLDNNNIINLRKNGFCIYLSSTLKNLRSRILMNDERPSISGNSIILELPQLLKERRPLYMKASDIIFDKHDKRSNKRTELNEKTNELLKIINAHGIS